jgi:hypothetical protein
MSAGIRDLTGNGTLSVQRNSRVASAGVPTPARSPAHQTERDIVHEMGRDRMRDRMRVRMSAIASLVLIAMETLVLDCYRLSLSTWRATPKRSRSISVTPTSASSAARVLLRP